MCEASSTASVTPIHSASLARAEALEGEITDLCARINAANHRLLKLIAELDDEQPWGAWGLASCAHWLNWRCGIGMNAAREKVRVAHALKTLPAISAAYESGELSFSRLRAVTRIADADNETELLQLARHATAAQVEKLVRAYRHVGRIADAERAMARHASRELHYYHDDDGSLVIRARLPAAEGALVMQALDAAMDALREQENTDTDDVTAETSHATTIEPEVEAVTAVTRSDPDRFAQRRADALTIMAETTLRHGPASSSAAEHYQVVVHVTAETLAGEADDRCELDNGGRLAIDSARRIACDSGISRITENAAGNPLDIGRKTRAVGPALRRALRTRDGGCRFPGCTQCRHVDAHHIRHWADGGETKMDNLVLLCRRHHRLVHEGGFGVARSAGADLVFTRPDGGIVDAVPRLPVIGDAAAQAPARPTPGPHAEVVVDASTWTIPAGPLDYGMAVEGLLRSGKCSSPSKRSSLSTS